MSDISGIATGALAAYGVRQAVTANNIANPNTPGFKASETVMKVNGGGGGETEIKQGSDSVDISKEAVDILDTANGYKANLKALQVADKMTKDVPDIFAKNS
jgi:flagellar basal body rod protein FlgB